MVRMPLAGLKAQSNTGEIVIFEVRRALDGFVLLDVFDDFLDLLDVVAQASSAPAAPYG